MFSGPLAHSGNVKYFLFYANKINIFIATRFHSLLKITFKKNFASLIYFIYMKFIDIANKIFINYI